METKRDYYEVLGVARDADDSTIKKAYRKLAKKYHPDTNVGNKQAEERFKEVTEAYDILSDPEKRKLYDRFGHGAFDGSAGDNPDPYKDVYGFGGAGTHEYHFEGDDIDDILKNFFGGGFEGRYARGGFSRDGSDLQAEISISFDEAVFGCEKTIQLTDAGGGTRSLKVRIPAGIDTGKSIRLREKGMPGSRGGKAGDLLLKVNVGSKPGFERRDMDIYTTVDIPFTTAVFGGEAEVQTLYGKVLCKIKEGTQSGTKIRLKGKGVVSMKNPKVHGDQYVTVQIQVPKNLNEEAKKKLKEFEQAYKGGYRSVA